MKFTSFGELAKHFKAKKQEINKIQSPANATRIMVTLAKSYAPIYSWDTFNSIISTKIKNKEYKVSSYVEGDFKQNLFANRVAGKFLYDEDGKKYGEGYKFYTAIKTPFFTVAVEEVRKAFPKLVIKEIKKIFNKKN